jgi:hypothetical protein
MMGLTDRFEPWTRRFQRDPLVATADEPAAADAEREPRTAAGPGRFARRSTPADPARPTDRPATGTTRG